ncbi:hypothetical protein TVAG_425620 [Trichomonas vaginalis G3]|uniref:Uncharacterized protein n=1 Tax=Trichomonas vaginalis (strain ATCC PRA-98 / G3) TaxID=412133 RepID=A2FI95_TRIV3|nr:hypothetical protein TVAGG3_0723410 [Trichomonas vaginalis G3]EAX95377.1 hypothetical protein TVAG_425620 [Trichomonas vaginalis G3]KAI5510745.1 hypothetical protein TVAGG3_0723410 [Trichomonas vaginalis G3]|eukprot:XP_001308307.1 hypothetical protein [Trichomonas vaginalis G3]
MISWCSSFWYKTCCSHCCSKEKCNNSESCDCCGEFRWYLHSMENYDDHKYKQWCCARLNRYCFQCCKECDSDMLRCCWIYVFIQGIAFIALAPFIAISLCCHTCYPCDDAEEQWENDTAAIIDSEEYDQLSTRRKIDEIRNKKTSEVVAPVAETPINV